MSNLSTDELRDLLLFVSKSKLVATYYEKMASENISMDLLFSADKQQLEMIALKLDMKMGDYFSLEKIIQTHRLDISETKALDELAIQSQKQYQPSEFSPIRQNTEEIRPYLAHEEAQPVEFKDNTVEKFQSNNFYINYLLYLLQVKFSITLNVLKQLSEKMESQLESCTKRNSIKLRISTTYIVSIKELQASKKERIFIFQIQKLETKQKRNQAHFRFGKDVRLTFTPRLRMINFRYLVSVILIIITLLMKVSLKLCLRRFICHLRKKKKHPNCMNLMKIAARLLV
jgi:hypothetical protein